MSIVNTIITVVVIVLLVIVITMFIKRYVLNRRPKRITIIKLSENPGKRDARNKNDHEIAARSFPLLSDDDKKKLSMKRPKPSLMPTFDKSKKNTSSASSSSDSKDDNADGFFNNNDFRFRVEAVQQNYVKSLPKNFSAISNWPDQILGVFDQEHCSNCWSYACCSMLTDRIRIKSNGKLLSGGDFISPTSFSACMKCGKDGACNRFCEGSYLDDVLQYMVEHGAIAQHDIDTHSSTPEAYLCFDAEKYGVKMWKGSEKYRVNLFPPSMLNTKKNLSDNEEAIKQEIYKNGTVVGIIKIYIPDDYRNIYLHKKGVYGYGWDSEPEESAGFHAICYLGWGEEDVQNKKTGKSESVKYWIIRNSWGDWGDSKGFAKILRGVNFGYCESDTFALTPITN